MEIARIRLAENKDFNSIMFLRDCDIKFEDRKFNYEPGRLMFHEMLNNKNCLYYVAEHKGKIIGQIYSGLQPITSEIRILSIIVHPKYRRNRIGSKLIDIIIKNTDSYIYNSIRTYFNEKSLKSIKDTTAFFNSIGFQPTLTDFPQYYMKLDN